MILIQTIVTDTTTNFHQLVSSFSVNTFVQLIAGIVSLIPFIALFRNSETNRRKRLKLDIELLIKLDINDPSYKVVKSYIDYTIKGMYKLPNKIKIYHKWEFILGVVYIILTAFIATITYNSNSTAWWVLTTLFATNGPMILLSSFFKTSFLIRYEGEV